MTFRRLSLLTLALAAALLAQKKPITLEALRGAAAGGGGLYSPVWAPNGYQFVFQRAGGLHLYDCREKRSRVVLDKFDALESLAVKDSRPEGAFGWQNRRVSEQGIQWAPDSKALLVARGADLFWLNAADGQVKQLTRTEAAEADPKLSPDGKKVSYRIDHDLYALDIASGKVTRLTQDGSETLLNGKLDWVYPEELDLNTAYWWSPDSARIAYLQFDVSKEMIYPQVDLLKTPAVYDPER
jgi:dipeptidyl-peptidase-4